MRTYTEVGGDAGAADDDACEGVGVVEGLVAVI
jgi:hypothetical protein